MSVEPRLTELLMQWEELRQQGQTVAVEDLCSDSPELLDELQRRIRALQAMDSVLAVTSSVVDGATVTSGTRGDERPSWPSVPGYEVLGVLGYGGMGVVYKVRNLAVGRVEALKMIQARFGAQTHALYRFQIEIQAMAQFEHARIVRIYAAGQHEGQPYFTMEYVGSGNLAQHMRHTAVTPESAVALTIKVAQAVHFLHTKNIVHRDLKPANILLKKEHEEPLVSDFGLARLFDRDIEPTGADGPGADPRLTQAGAVMGTAAYMSPEQAAGQTDQLTAATDVWAIGVILYELLTSHRPFQGGDSKSVRDAVRTAEPLPPRHFRPKLGLDLEAICLRCLEKYPLRRYATAQALVDDLECLQRGDPILPEHWPRRVIRKVRRYPAPSAAVAIFGVLAIVVALLVPVFRSAEPVDKTAEAEANLKTVLAEVASQRRTTLIPQIGPPAGYRWITRGAHDTVSQEPGKPFSIHAGGYALLELLPPHTLLQYRLQLEIHHDWGEENGKIGVYVGYSKRPTEQGIPVHCFCGTEFNDIAVLPGRPVEKGNEISISPQLLYAKAPGDVPNIVRGGPGISVPFQPAGITRVDAWRTLQIDVDATEIRVTLEQIPLPPLRRAELNFSANYLVNNSPKRPSFVPQFQPQEALGIYAYRASASFRSCTIEALPKQTP